MNVPLKCLALATTALASPVHAQDAFVIQVDNAWTAAACAFQLGYYPARDRARAGPPRGRWSAPPARAPHRRGGRRAGAAGGGFAPSGVSGRRGFRWRYGEFRACAALLQERERRSAAPHFSAESSDAAGHASGRLLRRPHVRAVEHEQVVRVFVEIAPREGGLAPGAKPPLRRHHLTHPIEEPTWHRQ